MKKISKYVLEILTSIYCVLYLAGLLSEYLTSDTNLISANSLMVVLLFLVFLTAAIYSWVSFRISGLLLQAWNILIWIFSWFIWEDAGMIILFAVPALIIGVLMNLREYKSRVGPKPTNQVYWKFVLKLLIVNYAILYTITMIAGISLDASRDYLTMPYILFPALAVLFYAGFIVSWFNELVAGILLCLWYIIVIVGSVAYSEFFNSGPWFVFGLTILFQGLAYISNYRTYRSRT